MDLERPGNLVGSEASCGGMAHRVGGDSEQAHAVTEIAGRAGIGQQKADGGASNRCVIFIDHLDRRSFGAVFVDVVNSSLALKHDEPQSHGSRWRLRVEKY